MPFLTFIKYKFSIFVSNAIQNTMTKENYLELLSKFNLTVEMEVYDYTANGTEYIHESTQEGLSLLNNVKLDFDLFIKGIHYNDYYSEFIFVNNIILRDEEDEIIDLDNEYYTEIHNEILKSINTNK